ncbi:hypothetical protein D3C75_866310 [compost metagenome]
MGVQQTDNLNGIRVLLHGILERRGDIHTHQGGGNAVPHHIQQDDAVFAVLQLLPEVEVPGQHHGGLVNRLNAQIFLLEGFAQHTLLNLLGQRQLQGHIPLLGLMPVQLRTQPQSQPDPGQ